MTETVLVTGGAGYIGSHTARQLVAAGYRVVVVDNLYSGHRWAVPATARFERMDAGDLPRVRELLARESVAAVVHFAGHIVVPESVADPLKYYRNNCVTTQNLVQACVQQGVERFVFSSSAAVYGIPDSLPVNEDAPLRPTSPYGATKLISEWLLRDVAASGAPFRYVALRYFNVAGAALDGTLGQATPEATHLIKVACEAACGRRARVEIYGSDYPTADGTGVRDYIHVEDLAAAHLSALRHLEQEGTGTVFNCGYGRGYSVREVLEMVQKVSGKRLNIVASARRPGDVPELVADNARILGTLGWRPHHDDLELICRTAFDWERRLSERLRLAASGQVCA
jgi:UDP-glucose 4-epimerase